MTDAEYIAREPKTVPASGIRTPTGCGAVRLVSLAYLFAKVRDLLRGLS